MNEKEFNSRLENINMDTSAEEITFDNMDLLSKVSSKYFTIFFEIFFNHKLSTSRKINNIKSLAHQLEDDSSVPFLATNEDSHLSIGKQEELTIIVFFLNSLNRRKSLSTTVGRYKTVFT